MILYRPTDGDVQTTPSSMRPRTCFLMTQLGQPIPDIVQGMRSDIEQLLQEVGYDWIDADSVTEGKDFLLKIWDLIVSVPVGIAIIDQDMSSETLSNIFYEIGWMQALGKETMVVKSRETRIPSDFVRTEYIAYDKHFERHFRHYFLPNGTSRVLQSHC